MSPRTSQEKRGYPAFLRLAGREVLVVGGGGVAREKARSLVASGARLRVVAPIVDEALSDMAESVERRAFEARDVDGTWFVVAAAPPEVNREVREACDRHRVFVIAVDDVASCSAFGAARLERGGVTIAISSDGRAPALVALLRRALEAVIPDDIDAWTAIAERARDAWKRDEVPIAQRRPLLLRALNALYERAPDAP